MSINLWLGPGAYEMKAPLAKKLAEKRNRITFGEGHKGYLSPNQLTTPGPGAYYPEFAENAKVSFFWNIYNIYYINI